MQVHLVPSAKCYSFYHDSYMKHSIRTTIIRK